MQFRNFKVQVQRYYISVHKPPCHEDTKNKISKIDYFVILCLLYNLKLPTFEAVIPACFWRGSNH